MLCTLQQEGKRTSKRYVVFVCAFLLSVQRLCKLIVYVIGVDDCVGEDCVGNDCVGVDCVGVDCVGDDCG